MKTRNGFGLLGGLALLAVMSSGCEEAGLRRELPNSLTKISIPPFDNKTSQPNVDQQLGQKVTQNFIVDGRLRVVSAGEADAILQGTLQRYDRIVLTRDANQVPQQYKLQLMVDLDFMDAKTGKLMWTTRRTVILTPEPLDSGHDASDFDSTNTRSLREFTTYYVLNNVGVPPEDEPAAADRVLEQMARRVVRRVIEGF
ncbi:MAG: LPS assembly lipoprotein LptE [candidate division FCPU426 bacterium]